MAYQNFYYNKLDGMCHIWDDSTGLASFPFEEYAYQIDPKGEYTTLTGLKVKRVTSWSKEAEKQGMIFEHDVPIPTRVLIDHYFESDEPSKNHRILFFDIEVEKGLKYSTAAEALNTITSVAYYFQGRYVCLLLDQEGNLNNCTKTITINDQEINVAVLVFRQERELLLTFLKHWEKINPTIISGWNCISAGSYVMTHDRLKKIEHLVAGESIHGDVSNILLDSGHKEQIDIITKIGTILKCSEDHKIPVYVVPEGRYVNEKSINKFTHELTVKEIESGFNSNSNIFVNIPKINNNNNDLTYRSLLLDNISKLLEYPNFDFYIKSPKIVEYVKNNSTLFPDINQRSRWGKYAGNEWRFKKLKHIPIELAIEYLSDTDLIDFTFSSYQRCTLDISKPISSEMCQTMGFIYSDGFYYKNQNTYNICNKDEKCINYYTDIIINNGIKRASYKPKRSPRDSCYYVDFSCQNYLGLLFSLIYETDLKKNLNVPILSSLSYKQFVSFISGTIDGDGSVLTNAVEICNFETTHEVNLESFQKLFFRNGILSKVQKTAVRIPANGNSNCQFIRDLNINQSFRYDKLQKIKFSDKLNSKSKTISWIETEDNFIVKCNDIIRTGNYVQMYDINTNKGYFIADSVLVHNCDAFDCPYLYNRICNVLGKSAGSRLSPIKIVYQRPLNSRDVMVTIAGVSQMDYMNLYKEFTYNEESSYSLDAISKKELKRGKYVYEGTLDQLFKENVDGFIEYNVNDVELLVALDKKMDLIEIARGICHKGHVPYEDFVYPSSYLEGAILTRCKQMALVSTSNLEKSIDYEIKKEECYIQDKRQFVRLDKYSSEIKDNAKIYELGDDGEYNLIGVYLTRKQKKRKDTIIVTAKKAKGAFVKPPKAGLHEWVYSIDLQSLYPSLIRTCNISLETQMYFIENWNELHMVNQMIKADGISKLSDYEHFAFLPDSINLTVAPIIKELFSERDPEPLLMDKSMFIDFMESNKFTISAAGVIYRTDVKGIIPTILEEWFNERIEYKDLAKKNKDNPELYQYYDRKQLITKILLNSLYGVLLLPSFRYYDKKNGESVTLSGQSVIKFSDIIGTQYYRKILNNPKFESPVIAGDTDSGYFSALALIDPTKSEEEIIKDVAEISNTLTGIINKSIAWLSTHHLRSTNNELRFMQEKLIRRAVWGQAKKRYALLTIDGDLVVKGFDLVRSSFPKIFRKQQTEIIEEMLHNKGQAYLDAKVRTFKKEYKNSPIFDIMLPSSVKEISKYKDAIKGTPIHVKSAQNYNKLLALHKIESMPPIDDGDKIVYAYMQQNPFGFETMALKGQGEDPEPLVEFVERFIDRERVFQSTFISKLDTIWHDLGWGKVEQQEPHNFF